MLALALALPDMSARLQRFSIPIRVRVPFPMSIPSIPIPLEKKVRAATYLCVLAIACATLSTALWLPLSLGGSAVRCFDPRAQSQVDRY
jgi:hypothetical protein